MAPERFTVDVPGASPVSAIAYRAEAARPPLLLLAHGAGAPQTHPFMVGAARALAGRGVTVVTYNFPYSEQRRRAPDRPPVLEATVRAMAGAAAAGTFGAGMRVLLGGKSMGGRIASQVLGSDDPTGADGLVLLGYPLHPPGRPDKPRTAHLPRLRVPVLVVQGERDAFGTEAEIREVFDRLPAPVTLHVVPGGDHSFGVPKRAAPPGAAPLDTVWDVVSRFCLAPAPGPRARARG